MKYRPHKRDSEQIRVRGVSFEAIMRSLAFARGVDDKRNGRPAAYDAFMFDQIDGDEFARRNINDHWNYERGRQWASLAPVSMPLKIGSALNPKAVALYRVASQREWTL